MGIKCVSQKNFGCHADTDIRDATGCVRRYQSELDQPFQISPHLMISNNRSGHQLWEKHDVKGEAAEGRGFQYVTAVAIDCKGQQVEGVKGDSGRQENICKEARCLRRTCSDRCEGGQKESQIFEINES